MADVADQSAVYGRVVDYLSQTYALYERAGVRYPLVIFRPDASQRHDVDSVLGDLWPVYEDGFAFRDDHHLRALQQSGRRLENRPTFSFRRLETGPLRIHAHLGTYFDMMATCDALERELKDYFVANPALHSGNRLERRFRLHQAISPRQALTDGKGRSAAIGVATLTVFNHAGTYKAIFARRSSRAGTEPGYYHVLPALVFQPMHPSHAAEWRVSHHLYREYLEELFGMEEIDAPPSHHYFHDHPAFRQLQSMLDDGRAGLYLTGVSMNLLTLRPEICTLLLIKDPSWYERAAFQAAWETEQRSITFAPIAGDEALLAALPPDVQPALYASMTAAGSAALWLGVEHARSVLSDSAPLT